MSRAQPQFEKLPVAEASSRQKHAPAASDLSALLKTETQGTEQKAAILRTIIGHQPGLTPLPEIAKCAAQYGARIKALRGDLKPFGLCVQCYMADASERGRRSRHSWYRIERSEFAQIMSHLTSTLPKGDIEKNQQLTPSASIEAIELVASPARSTMLDFELGRRVR